MSKREVDVLMIVAEVGSFRNQLFAWETILAATKESRSEGEKGMSQNK
jgi:hypothetical protein